MREESAQRRGVQNMSAADAIEDALKGL